MPKQSKITTDMLNWAFERKLDGYSYGEIAEALGVHSSYLKRLLEEYGVVVMYPPLKYPGGIRFNKRGIVVLTEEILLWAQSKLLQGYTRQSVAKSLGVSTTYLVNSLKKCGLSVQRPPLVCKEKASTGRQSHEGT